MTYPALMVLGSLVVMTVTTAQAQSVQRSAENTIEPVASASTELDLQADPASPSPARQPTASPISELAQLKAITLLAVLPYFNSLATLAQVSTTEKESLFLKLQADIGTCETPTCLITVQTELNRILMDRVASLYKNVGWSGASPLGASGRSAVW